MSIESSNKSQQEVQDMFGEVIQGWNNALIQVLESKAQALGKILPPDIDTDITSFILEKITLESLESKRGMFPFLVLTAPSGVGKTTFGKELERQGVE